MPVSAFITFNTHENMKRCSKYHIQNDSSGNQKANFEPFKSLGHELEVSHAPNP